MEIKEDSKIKKLLGRMISALRYLIIGRLNSKILHSTSKILRLKSEANVIDVEDIKKGKRKDTIFIMGSGYSINDITKEEWQHIEEVGDTLSFNYFFRGEFVPMTYHICGEISGAPNYGSVLMNSNHRECIQSYYNEIFRNTCYKDCIYFLRYTIDTYTKTPITIALWALFFLKAFKNKQVCLYRIVTDPDVILEPSDNIHGIVHWNATLSDAINISYILGYKQIVLVGIDLYDRRYFWLGENETQEDRLRMGKTYSNIHNTADWAIRGVSVWNKHLVKKGVRLYIYNPRSLLNKVLPIYGNIYNEEELKK